MGIFAENPRPRNAEEKEKKKKRREREATPTLLLLATGSSFWKLGRTYQRQTRHVNWGETSGGEKTINSCAHREKETAVCFCFFLSCDVAEGWLTQDSRELLMSKASETSRAHWSSWLNSAEVFEKPAVQPHVAQWDARWQGESFCKGRPSSRSLVLTHQAVCAIYLFIRFTLHVHWVSGGERVQRQI